MDKKNNKSTTTTTAKPIFPKGFFDKGKGYKPPKKDPLYKKDRVEIK